VRLLPCGPRAVLAEYDSLDEVMGVAAHLRSLSLPGIVDVVPAARTVLVHHDGADVAPIERALGEAVAWTAPDTDPVVIRVRYDGEDLASVAAATGLSATEVVDIHRSATYAAAFCGFMPGFAYLTGLDPRLHLPRRATPRPRVPAGAVAIASDFTGVYPSASPGGWHLIGTTDAVLWDESRSVPALIAPGAIVRFVPR
jgi:5-oxoprolinase (ATP-hydrolysing) subunit B